MLVVWKIAVCEKSHSLNEQGGWSRSVICIPRSVASVSIHCTMRAVFPTPQLCFRRVMACGCDHTPHITSTVHHYYKANLRLERGICPEKFQLYKIRNGWHAAIIDLNMNNIWKTVPNNYSFTIKKIAASGRDMPLKISTWSNGQLAAIIEFYMNNIWKSVQEI